MVGVKSPPPRALFICRGVAPARAAQRAVFSARVDPSYKLCAMYSKQLPHFVASASPRAPLATSERSVTNLFKIGNAKCDLPLSQIKTKELFFSLYII